MALHADGLSITAIAAKVGLCRSTVRKYLRADGFPEWSSRRTLLSAGTRHGEYLRTRWEEGVQDALTLWQELQQRGFHGSLRSIPIALREAAAMQRLNGWQVFRLLEVPSAMIGLVWNS